MQYYAKFEDDEGAIMVTFPDLPGCITCGYADREDVIADAIYNATEALNGYLDVAVDMSGIVPKPKTYEGQEYHAIEVEAQVAAKVQECWEREDDLDFEVDLTTEERIILRRSNLLSAHSSHHAKNQP